MTARAKSRDGIRIMDVSAIPGAVNPHTGPYLRAPFMPRAVRFRVIESWAGGEDNALTHAVVVPYLTRALVIERLNLVMPGQWSTAFEHGSQTVTCFLTVGGQVFEDVGEGSTRKQLVTDAFKRAAVQVGIGVSLPAVPRVLLHIGLGDDDGVYLRPWREQVRGEWRDTLTLTLGGERHCRERYRAWLLRTGIPAFGPPIDHGDVADCWSTVDIPIPPPSAKRRSSARQSPASRSDQPPPLTGEEAAQQALDAELARNDDLRGERAAANAAMAAMGMPLAGRLAELRGAKDRRGFEALLARLATIGTMSSTPEGSGEEQGSAIEQEGGES